MYNFCYVMNVIGAFVFILSLSLGKTLLAKAVANQTAATFLRVVGSELIQKYLVREKITRIQSFRLLQFQIAIICSLVFIC